MTDNTNPDYYKFPSGAEVIDISEHLSANGAQALQYIARATRQDGKVKGNPVEDLRKALWFVQREIARLEPVKTPREYFEDLTTAIAPKDHKCLDCAYDEPDLTLLKAYDPWPKSIEEEETEEEQCLVPDKDGWVCTRPKGHGGLHLAGYGHQSTVYAPGWA